MPNPANVATSPYARTRTVSFSGPKGDGSNPGQTTRRYDEMAARWELIDDLLAGTDAMRSRAQKWLPREPSESVAGYRIRLLRSFLYAGFKDTVENLGSLPFTKPVAVSNPPIDERLAALEDDADGAGTSLTQQARSLFKDAMISHGLCHLLVDYPVTSGGMTIADERAIGARPIFIPIHPRDLIGWREEESPGGGCHLVQARFREWRYEAVGEFGEDQVEYVREIKAPPRVAPRTPAGYGAAAGSAYAAASPGNLGTWRLWKKSATGWDEVGGGTHTYDGVPVVTAYASRTGYMQAEPPMADLAEMNLCHYHSFSDQRNCLRYGRMPMLSMTGISQEEYDKPTTVAPSQVFKSVRPEARFGFVEPTGAALAAGETDLEKLEDRMQVLGMQPLVQKSANSTAAGKIIDKGKNESAMQSWVRALEDAYREAYEVAAEWIGVKLPSNFDVDIFSDFGISSLDSTILDWLLKARLAGEIDRETFLREVKRRGVFADSVDVQEVMDRIDAEPPKIDPSLAALGAKFGQPGDGGGGGGPPAAPPFLKAAG